MKIRTIISALLTLTSVVSIAGVDTLKGEAMKYPTAVKSEQTNTPLAGSSDLNTNAKRIMLNQHKQAILVNSTTLNANAQAMDTNDLLAVDLSTKIADANQTISLQVDATSAIEDRVKALEDAPPPAEPVDPTAGCAWKRKYSGSSSIKRSTTHDFACSIYTEGMTETVNTSSSKHSDGKYRYQTDQCNC